MKKLILFIVLFASTLSAKDIKLSEKSADRFIIKQTISDTLKLVSFEFKSETKKFKYDCDSTCILLKGNDFQFDYSNISNYNQEIIYQAIVKFITKNGKIKSESITIFNEAERINPRGEAMQCLGTTKKGSQCKRTTTDPSGYCWQHK